LNEPKSNLKSPHQDTPKLSLATETIIGINTNTKNDINGVSVTISLEQLIRAIIVALQQMGIEVLASDAPDSASGRDGECLYLPTFSLCG
jgi:hypothetical protein